MDYTTEYSPYDKWKAQAAKDEADLKAGKMPAVYHCPVEMLTLEEIIEKYGIDQETIDRIKEQVNNQSYE